MKKFLIGLAAFAIGAAPAVAQSTDTRLRVENHSGINASIVSIRITNEHNRTYEILRPFTITAGYNRIIRFNDGEGHNHCYYNVTARFSNGTEATRTAMNVCQRYQWEIYDLNNVLK